MTRVSHILCMSLVALIVLTAQSAAVARTMSGPSGQMVICTGSGPMMVYLDEKGEPTGAPQICPEYALSLIIALAHADVLSASNGAWFDAKAQQFGLSHPVLKFGTPSARGPPDLMLS